MLWDFIKLCVCLFVCFKFIHNIIMSIYLLFAHDDDDDDDDDDIALYRNEFCKILYNSIA